MSSGGDPSAVAPGAWKGSPALPPLGTGVQRLPAVRPPVVHLRVEGDTLLLTEASPVRRTLLRGDRAAGGLQDELRRQRHFWSRPSREWPPPARPPVPSLGLRLPGGSEDGGRAATGPRTPTRAGHPGALGGTRPAPRHLGLLPAGAVHTLAPHSPRVLRQTPVCGTLAAARWLRWAWLHRGSARGQREQAQRRGTRLGTPGLEPALGGAPSRAHEDPGRQLAQVPHGSCGRSAALSLYLPAHMRARTHPHTPRLHPSAPCPGPTEHCPEAKPESAPPAQPGHLGASTRPRAASGAEGS